MGAALVLGSASTFTSPTAGAADVNGGSPGPILKACHNLRALTSNDRLINGPYTLSVFSEYVQLSQNVVFPGEQSVGYEAINWTRTNPRMPATATDQTLLALYCNGDLAIRRSNGTVLWHSNTANRGVTRLALTSGGNLLLLTAGGAVVWQAGTGSSTMPANSILPSNRKLTSDRNVEGWGVRDSLSMQTDGNLVYRQNVKVVWQSNTHVPGSRAGLTTRGQLAVITPDGRYIWMSRSVGSRHSLLDVGLGGVYELVDNNVTPVWGLG
ncbi:hypothetical protein GCM10009740_24310 [Terrabacter terrae]|uniref:Bulb-type lectin domain-containing protein n=2 Tax=Terrabacter terrae TaxID=318434 RepID=A0ABN2UHD7_9MICO